MEKHHWWERLNPEEKEIMTIMAMLSPPVSLDDLIKLTDHSAVKILGLMEVMVEKKILTTDQASGRGYYHFQDFQQAWLVIELQKPEKLQRLSRELINFVKERQPEGIKKSLTLTHLQHISGLRIIDPRQSIQAADYCLTFHLKEYAGNYYRQALDSLEKCKSLSRIRKELYIDAVLGLITAHGHLMTLDEQKPLVLKALDLAKRLADQERLAKLTLVCAQIKKNIGDYKKAAHDFDAAWALAQQLGKEDLLKKTALMTTDFLFWQGQIALAVDRYEQVIGNLEEFPSDEATLRACATLGWCYGLCGQVARGVGLIEAVRARANHLLRSEVKVYVDQMHREEVKIYADLRMALTLLEARRINETEACLEGILSLPEAVLGHYVLWEANAALAYVLYCRGDLAGCYEAEVRSLEHSQRQGGSQHRGSWYLEYIQGLEKAGFLPEEKGVNVIIERMLQWPDTYMQGVALHFRARQAEEGGHPRAEVYHDLKAGLNLLNQAGAKLEISRTQLLLARLHLSEGKFKKAEKLIAEAWGIISAVNEKMFPEDLKKYLVEENREELLIKTIVEVGNTLGTVRERKLLLEKIIDSTMRLTMAERGGLFLPQPDGRLELAASRNLDLTMVEDKAFSPKRKMIQDVAATALGTAPEVGVNDRPGGNDTGWMICSPVILQDQVLGVLYLDGNLSRPFFPGKDLPLLRAICSQVAIALDNVRAYGEIAELRDRLQEETRFYRKESEFAPQYEQIIGTSPAIKQVLQQIRKVAPTDSTVLITGETGVGKELVARGVHRLSLRADGPFIPVNPAAFAPELIASELFGHERGAFTGAVSARVGRFELAHCGTLFFDDIQNISMEIQAKLLRALQEKEFERVGGSRVIKSNFRLIAATNQPIEELVTQGRFRSDLYYRLNIFPIHVPPLRERKEDISLLANYFFEQSQRELGRRLEKIDRQTMNQLLEYHWPGNIRELKAIIERMVILSEDQALTVPNLKKKVPLEDKPEKWLNFIEFERSYIIRTLEKCNWKVSGPAGAAELLALKPTTLYSKIQRLGIKKKVAYTDR